MLWSWQILFLFCFPWLKALGRTSHVLSFCEIPTTTLEATRTNTFHLLLPSYHSNLLLQCMCNCLLHVQLQNNNIKISIFSLLSLFSFSPLWSAFFLSVSHSLKTTSAKCRGQNNLIAFIIVMKHLNHSCINFYRGKKAPFHKHKHNFMHMMTAL